MQIRISELIDRSPMSAFQYRTVAFCGLIALLEGLDVQTMALVVPSVSDEWREPTSAFGGVLAASFIGLMLGALMGGLAGDRFGRRTVLLTGFVGVGIASVLTATADGHTGLFMWRLLTGIAIGVCLPNFTVLTAEYVPARRQALFITLLYTAIPLGGVLGGLVAPVVVAAWGWRAVFIVAGVIPLAIAIGLFFGLPESPRFLAGRAGRHALLGRILERITPSYSYSPNHVFIVDDKVQGPKLRALFDDGRLVRTAALWLIMFCSLGGFYLVTSWLPAVLAREGWSNFEAARSLSFFFMGGTVGCVAVGWLIDRYGPYRVLSLCFLIDAALTALVGLVPADRWPAMAAITLAGTVLSMVQTGIVVLAARIYPTAIRSTGVGWGLGIGRIGAVVSPLLGAAAMGADWSRAALFVTAAIPPALCALVVVAMARHLRTRNEPSVAVSA